MAQPTQIINGQSYTMYSPEWQAAREAAQVQAGSVAGAAAGTAAGQAAKSQWETKYPGWQTPGPNTMNPSVTSLISALSAGSGGGGSVAMSGGGGGGPMPTLDPTAGGAPSVPNVGHVAPVDTSAADSAIFARAKDKAGLIGRSGLTSLRSALGARNLLGSGAESRGTASVLNAGQQQLGEVNREQAISGMQTAQHNADTNYAGDLTQRGQDIGSAESNANRSADAAKTSFSGQIAMRGQNIQAESERNRLALEQSQLQAQQRQTSLSALTAALKSGGGMSTAAY